MKNHKILITDHVHPYLIESLRNMAYQVYYQPEISREEVLQKIQDFTGIIINSRIIADKELLEKGRKLKFVARCGSGREVIDYNSCKLLNIKAITSPEGNKQAVAEHALGMLLCIMNNIHIAHHQVIKFIWKREENRGFELFGKKIGIIGFGHTGSSFAKVLRGFNPKILAYDKYKKGFGNEYVKEVSLTKIFNEAEVVSLHLPLTNETIGYADDVFFNSFKKKIWFINTSRGQCLKLESLLHGIEKGKIKGAALDVLENEKFSSYSKKEKALLQKILRTNKVLVTPHIAGWTYESKEKIARILVQKIKRLTHQ
ncbi:MAG: hydroxyacid dehydrogenase [Chitinophagales bacterium]|nr:hydroxyacid dehydrogenase [Chitinophagales bacterium]